jgi:exopolysaccharide production protein ExoQ
MSLPQDTTVHLPALRRIRGDAIPAPSAMPWRRQRQIAEAHLRARTAPSPQTSPVAWVGDLPVDMDAIFAFLITVSMVFIAQLGSLGAAAIAGLTPLYLLVRRRGLIDSLVERAFLFAFPALALCSVLWSQARSDSLRFAVELTITVVAGVLFASAVNKRAVVRAVALAFAVYVADAVLTGGTVKVGVGMGGQAFSGLTESKNLMADIAGTGLLLGLGALAISLARREWLHAGLFAVAAGLGGYALVAARSAGALMAVAVACLGFFGLLMLMRAGRAVRAWTTGMMMLAMLVAGLNYRMLATTLIQWGASAFDKDPTLTGRTYLWYRAQDVIQGSPLLGRGYSAFWLQGNIDAEGLWQYAGILNRGGFNFHNTLVDLRVTLGWLGVAVFVAVVALGLFLLVRRFVVRPTIPVVCWTSIALYEISRMAIESVAFQQFYHPTLLLFAALGLGVGAHELQNVPRRVRPVRYRRVYTPQFSPVDYANTRLRWGVSTPG